MSVLVGLLAGFVVAIGVGAGFLAIGAGVPLSMLCGFIWLLATIAAVVFVTTKPKGVVYPFRPLLHALIDKDERLYRELCHLSPSIFWKEWKKVYPEDFPQGGRSLPSPTSIMPRR